MASSPAGNACRGGGPVSAQTDPSYPTDVTQIQDDRTRTKEFLKDINLGADGSEGTGGSNLRNFSYLIMSEDHTTGLSGIQTPRSEVAQNDAAVGQLIAALSRSKYWPSTAVIVTEDDSQDGADHVDGHRNVLLTASPWLRHQSADGCQPGYIGHTPYDQASVLRTIELLLGVPPMSAYDAGATPMYGLFQDKDQPSQLTAEDLRPYDVAAPPPFLDETVASLPKSQGNAELMALSSGLNTAQIDRGGAQLEVVLWRSLRSDALPPELALRWQAERAGVLSAQDEDAIDGPHRVSRGLPVVDVVRPQDRASTERSSRTGAALRAGTSSRCG